MTTSLISTTILMVVGLLIGIHYTPLSVVLIFVIILLLSFALTSLGTYYWEFYGKLGRLSVNTYFCCVLNLFFEWSIISVD